jgi:hypothetical protein
VNEADRPTGSAFAPTLKSSVAAPCPDVEFSVTQDAPDAADQEQSRSVEMVRRPLPPSGGKLVGEAVASTAHRSRPVGPTLVDADDPQAERGLSRIGVAVAVMTRTTQRWRLASTTSAWERHFLAELPARRNPFQETCASNLNRIQSVGSAKQKGCPILINSALKRPPPAYPLFRRAVR